MNNQPHAPSAFDRELEREREIEEQHRQRALQQQEELAQREREHNERQDREPQQREQYQPPPPHQNNTGSIHIHQPVANRLPTAIHSPGGLLANHGGAPPSAPLGAPSGPGNAFGGPLHSDSNRSIQHNSQNAAAQQQQHQLFGPSLLIHSAVSSGVPLAVSGGPGVGFTSQQLQQQQQQEAAASLIPFGGPITPTHSIPGAPLGQGGQPGQQPILNDALSYLDQVKVQFADQPDVYNKFLDIMKDFKSQAIDTPGVINRVSELFAGHPNLIQGFNTFLPPGYRIECGTGNDPNTIRVTTPMGTTVQSITGSGRALLDTVGGPGSTNTSYQYPGQLPGNWQPPQSSMDSPEVAFSPPHQPAGPVFQNQGQPPSFETQQASATMHQQQQRGVSQLTTAVATLGQPQRNASTPTPAGPAGMNGGGAQAGLEKRGPVEFNHAISYVNKIKNRFQDKPEIYKQFLEILQTYQRESKPIQDVYAQVTILFNSAPDLLEDFKQFLPESAAHAKAAAKAAEDNLAAMASSSAQAANNARAAETKMPPVGNFTVPPSSGKENKRGKRTANMVNGPLMGVLGGESSRGIGPNQPNKRVKHNHIKAQDAPAVSPTLTPVLPEPLAPIPRLEASPDELAWFDRVKKYIGNKSTMNELLKLCNLFSNDLIDRNALMHKMSSFIGANADLMNWFKVFIKYEGEDEVIDNLPKAPNDRVALSNCRGLGPSYRLLPKRERLKPCTGRDEMCKQVLNDAWASHPTWASEDSGFVAHRKNVFEEGLHRIEEERHDYDFNIETNYKVIQLLEPIAQSLLARDPNDREAFRMPNLLGGQSQAIYRRVLKKIYGAERGPDVVNDLFKDPAAVLPVVLARLKQKDEEWRFTQREWEKVWSAQTHAMYLKSLDHMGIQVKATDKKVLAQKYLVDSIKTKHEEQQRQRSTKGKSARQYQYSHDFSDQNVIADLLRIMVVYANNATQQNNNERRRIIDFFEKFVATFFGLSDDLINDRTNSIIRNSPDEEYEDIAPTELPNGRGPRQVNGKKGDLRRGVLDKGRNSTKGRGHKEDSATGSRDSSPDGESLMEEDMVDLAEDQAITEVTNERWAAVPRAATIQGTEPLAAEDAEMKVDQPIKRAWYSLYCNQTIFFFFSLFQTLYGRLKDIKDYENGVRKAVLRSKAEKPAGQIGLKDDKHDYYSEIGDGETYYKRTLALVEDFVQGHVEENKYQEYLRNYYLMKGWQIYTVADHLKTLCRQGAVCSTTDAKEKTPDLIEQFIRDREMKETSYNAEINLRKQADKYIKDGDLFLIRWYPRKAEVTTQWITKGETTFDLDDMERKERWQYYVSSFIRVEPTEGVPRHFLRKSVLTRDLPSAEADLDDPATQRKPLVWDENLTLRICVNTFKILYNKESGAEYFIYADKELGGNATRKRLQKFEDVRNQKFRQRFGSNTAWTKDMNQGEVEKINQDFQKWVSEGVIPGTDAVEKQ